MRVALLQMNPTVGDLKGNAERISTGVRQAQRQRADLVVTSELALLGYPPRDMLLDSRFISSSSETLRQLARDLADAPAVLVGLAEVNPLNVGRPLFNTAALLRNGQVEDRFRKRLLPTYDVFDEDRYFEPASSSAPALLKMDGRRIGISICEDIWNDRDFWHRQRYHFDPVEQLAGSGAQFLVNLSASPFTVRKQRLRECMLSNLARKHQMPILYVNQIGGNDDLVFDGRSCAFDASGRLMARARAFVEDIAIVDLAGMEGQITSDDFIPESEIWRALVLGTQDYVRKCGFNRVLLGLSGGVDSSITAVVASEAIGPKNVVGVLMPSPYSSEGSVEDALVLARNLGIQTLTLPISGIMKVFDRTLLEAFDGHERDVTEENIQARIRGALLMALSNKYRSLLLTTGNKSELAVGYCTLYGDMSGGLAVISDVPKTMIYRISQWLNTTRGREIIPASVLQKAPSAELRPNQTDQDSLPPYDMLDEILVRYIEQHQSAEEIVTQGFDEATVRRVLGMVKAAEFKRKQAAPGLKVTDRAFGTGWRMPVARRN